MKQKNAIHCKIHNRVRKSVIVFGKYLVGGVVYFWVGYAVFAVAYSVFGWHWFTAKVSGDVIGRAVSYFVQRYWAFNVVIGDGEGRYVGKYTAQSILSIIVDYLMVGGLNYFNVSPYIGQIVSAAFFTVWNYLWFKLWVFKKQNE